MSIWSVFDCSHNATSDSCIWQKVYAVVEKYLVAWHGYAVFDVFGIYTIG